MTDLPPRIVREATEIKPCPFCGAEMMVREHSAFHPEHSTCWLADCGEAGGGLEISDHDYAAWNMRALAGREEWREIDSAPKDTSQGDFWISRWNERGDCLWIKVVRNPGNHMGMKIASHWMPMIVPDPASVTAFLESESLPPPPSVKP